MIDCFRLPKKNIVLVCILLCFIFVRILYLDRDLPPGNITEFGSKDEQAYNFTALNLYHFGSLSKEINDQYSIRGAFRTLGNNIFTYVTLTLLGNNYFGLRASAVLASIIILVLFFRLLDLSCAAYTNKKLAFIQVIIGFYCVIDFGFLVASRNAAPVIFRCLYMMLIMTYAIFLTKKQKYKLAFHLITLGICCSFLIFFSYLTNAFILIGIVIFFGLKGIVERESKRTLYNLLLLFIGVLLGVIIANILFVFYYGHGIKESILKTIGLYGGRIENLEKMHFGLASILALIRGGIGKFFYLFSSNMFMLNWTLLLLCLLACRTSLQMILKREKPKDIQLMSFSLIVAYVIQAFFYNPHSSKWIIILFPVILVHIISSIVLNKKDQEKEAHMLINVDIWTWGVFLMIVGLYIYKSHKVGIIPELKKLSLISIILLIVILLIGSSKKNIYKKKALPIMMILTILPNAFLSMKYCLIKPEYHYRDACIALSNIVGDSYMAGAWTNGFRLYTNGNTFFPWYQVMDIEEHNKGMIEIFENKLADFTVTFSEGDIFDIEQDIGSYGKGFRMEKRDCFFLGKGALGATICVYERKDL